MKIYLDNSMTTRPSERAVSVMLPFLTDMWGSASAPHQMGQELFPAIEEAYRSIYALLGANETDHFIFTSCGAEAVNHAFFSAYFDVTRKTGKNQFVISGIDEAPAIMSLNRLEQFACVTKVVNPDHTGKVTLEAISEAITPRTAMISLSWANGLTGVINPVQEIGKLCHDRGILLHLEATHVLGKLFFDLHETRAHFLSFNGDNLHATKGTGGLYIRSGTAFSPFIVGGLEQGGHRAGVLNIPALVSLGCAAHETRDARDLLCTETARLRDKLEMGICAEYPDAMVFFKDQERLPNCTVIAFPGIMNEALLFALHRKQVYASIGGGSFQQIGLILTASGVPQEIAQTAISFSLSRYTTEDEIDRAIAIICETASRFQKTSVKITSI